MLMDMHIKSAEFVKGIVSDDAILGDGRFQAAFLGRSNVGKSSIINVITGKKELARSSPTPGRTKEINFFLVNKDFYLVDLPGYGFAKGSLADRQAIQKLIYWYLLLPDDSPRKFFQIIDAEVGPTHYDREILNTLEAHDKQVVIVANKIDKIKKSAYVSHLRDIQNQFRPHTVIPFSAEQKIGVQELLGELVP